MTEDSVMLWPSLLATLFATGAACAGWALLRQRGLERRLATYTRQTPKRGGGGGTLEASARPGPRLARWAGGDCERFPVAAERFRQNNFDFLRLALAVLVILSHSYYLVSGTEDSEPLMRASRGQIEMGALAVNFFFIISGFLITHSWFSAPRVRDYLKKRVLRIFPGFV